MVFTCHLCETAFNQLTNLRRHEKIHEGKTYDCDECSQTFGRIDNLKHHKQAKHDAPPTKKIRQIEPEPSKPPTRPSVIVANPSHIPPPPPPPPSPVAEPELINHMLEKHEYRDDNAENYTTELNLINRGYIIGNHKKVNCRICLKTMGSNNLEKHMRQHEKKNTS